jgi:hypothetical protein
MADGLLNGWVRDLMDKSMSSKGRWLKIMIKQLIPGVHKGTELVARITYVYIDCCIYGPSEIS